MSPAATLRKPRRTALAVVAALVLAAAAGSATGVRAQASEYAVKATFLYKFAPFVEWPRTGLTGSDFVICVQGEDPFGQVLDRAVGGQNVDGRPVVVRRVETVSATSGCHIAYLGGSRRQAVGEGLKALRGAPVLTVTDGTSPHGMIHFVVAASRVRFDIDEIAAEDAGLGLSSKLLNLALSVKARR